MGTVPNAPDSFIHSCTRAVAPKKQESLLIKSKLSLTKRQAGTGRLTANVLKTGISQPTSPRKILVLGRKNMNVFAEGKPLVTVRAVSKQAVLETNSSWYQMKKISGFVSSGYAQHASCFPRAKMSLIFLFLNKKQNTKHQHYHLQKHVVSLLLVPCLVSKTNVFKQNGPINCVI